jgi:uncharacterized protein YggE
MVLEAATEDALNKAQIIAKASGIKLGPLQQITYDWNEHYYFSETEIGPNRFSIMSHKHYKTHAGSGIEPKDIKLRDTVTFSWEIV